MKLLRMEVSPDSPIFDKSETCWLAHRMTWSPSRVRKFVLMYPTCTNYMIGWFDILDVEKDPLWNNHPPKLPTVKANRGPWSPSSYHEINSFSSCISWESWKMLEEHLCHSEDLDHLAKCSARFAEQWEATHRNWWGPEKKNWSEPKGDPRFGIPCKPDLGPATITKVAGISWKQPEKLHQLPSSHIEQTNKQFDDTSLCRRESNHPIINSNWVCQTLGFLGFTAREVGQLTLYTNWLMVGTGY